VLYDWAFRDEPFGQVVRRRRGLYLGLAATWVLLAALMATGPRATTVGFDHGVSAWDYAVNQCVSVIRYVRLALWPHPLILDYGFVRPLAIGAAAPHALLLLVLLGATAVAFARRPWAAFAALWFFVILAPTSSFVPIATEVAAERRAYLPLAGIVVMVVAAIWPLVSKTRWLGPVLLVVATIALASVTWQRNALYRDPAAMWQANTVLVPDNHRAFTNLGIALAQSGRLDDAVTALEQAVEIEPRSTRANYNLANVLVTLGQRQEAIARYEVALETEPRSAAAHHNLGLVLAQVGRLDEAIARFREAILLRPGDAEAHHNLGKALALSGHGAAAVDHLREAARLEPRWAAPLGDAARVLATWPDADVRDGPEAVRLAEEATALIAHADPQLLDTLAAAYAESGRFGEAVATATAALGEAEAAGNDELARQIRTRIELYRRREPYHMPGAPKNRPTPTP
jgi:Flp pilus assembly protein TadD